jgi:FlaA1/EpsC-like NDP-sugar epimerase
VVGIRPGEKIHEQMIGPEDALTTYDCGEHYVILPPGENPNRTDFPGNLGARVPSGFTYSSDSNLEWMTRGQLEEWIRENSDERGNIPLK